ncbi:MULTISPECIES: hypothetical protein [Paraburkholderia]|nr:hypothetical protein [Paraburkholderia fungorum]
MTAFSQALDAVVNREEVGERVRRSVQCELDDASKDKNKQHGSDDQI